MEKFEQTIFISPNSKELNNSVEVQYFQKLTNIMHPAEIYHENSKIFPHSNCLHFYNEDKLEEMRQWYFETFKRPAIEDLEDNQEILIDISCDKNLKILLEKFSNNENNQKLLYAVDMFVWIKNKIYIFNPEINKLLLQQCNAPKVDEFSDSDEDIIIFLVIVPWRYMSIMGPRGYRKALLDAGKVGNIIQAASLQEGIKTSEKDFFIDDYINNYLNIDGVENIAICLYGVRG